MNWKRKTCNLHLAVIPHVYVNYCTYTLTLFDTRIFIFWRRWGFLRRRRRHRVQITITYRNRMFLSIPLLFYQFFRQVSVYFGKFLAKDKKSSVVSNLITFTSFHLCPTLMIMRTQHRFKTNILVNYTLIFPPLAWPCWRVPPQSYPGCVSCDILQMQKVRL